MIDGKRVLAVVPARSGSKGIPDKNMRKVAGRTLIQRVAETLAEVDLIDRRIISTDAKRYATHAQEHGLEAPFLRPAELASDTAGSVETVQHALHTVEEQGDAPYDIVLHTAPTSPLRRAEDIEEATHLLVDSDADSVVTISPVDEKFHPRKLLTIEEDGRLWYHREDGKDVVRRQELDRFHYRNGICYAVTRECLLEKGAFITDRTIPLVADRPIVNIDHPIELAWAEFLLERA